MKIGNVKLDNPLILAPMANITDLPFRLLCRRQGAALVYTEMINMNSLSKGKKATEKLCLTCKEEKPISYQLFGLKKEHIKPAVEKIEQNFDILDFNFGCPAPQIIGEGFGADLLKNPEKIGEIIRALVNSTSKPVTAKMRLGYDKNDAVKIAKIIEDNGASAIAIHARTFTQGYKGKANWNAIKEVKEKVNIPIIGNGDVKNGVHAKKLLEYCDGVMIGRAAIGDPFIFDRINLFLKTGEMKPMPTINEKIDMFLEYYKLAEKYGYVNIHTIRMSAQNFISNVRNSSLIRSEINKINDVDLLVKYMEKIKTS
ncbi:MAG: tRNA dihydrouridine synthase DusB [Nanoarchaeota archaeon]|nr:tRNA dihydrouridine synthase DusB [Nanoarchaeota archaeon]